MAQSMQSVTAVPLQVVHTELQARNETQLDTLTINSTSRCSKLASRAIATTDSITLRSPCRTGCDTLVVVEEPTRWTVEAL